MKQKKNYIEDLLNSIRALEARIAAVGNSEALSFSFFRDAFRRIQDMMKLLHEMEMQQIEDMKVQMEKLVMILSENESGKEDEKTKEAVHPVTKQESITHDEKTIDSNTLESNDEEVSVDLSSEEVIEDITLSKAKYNHLAEGVILPGYVNPQANKSREAVLSPPPLPEKVSDASAVPKISELENKPSLNDLHQASTAQHEVKRNLSLNDRFFYQRELFSNNAKAMNAAMNQLNRLQTMEEVELYLRENTTWDFEDEHVKSFLDLLGKSEN